jgi:hypothetical protein
MIYMWFTGKTIINWPLRKIVTLFFTTISKPGLIEIALLSTYFDQD